MTTSKALGWLLINTVSLVVVFLIIRYLLITTDHSAFNRGVEVTKALDQKEGEIWVNQELKLKEKNQSPSAGKVQIKCESSACLKAQEASQ